MIGILVEKPSAAKHFAAALGGMSGTYHGEKYLIAVARGHLYEYCPPDAQVGKNLAERYKSWDIASLPWDETDFKWIRAEKPGAAGIIARIRGDLTKCDEIAIATDVDPTGEGGLLAWEIIDELKFGSKKISRMYFTEEEPKPIQEAFKNRKVIRTMTGDPEYRMATYRTQWDFLSMQFTRVATKCGDGRSVLRQGRLKSAMVLLVGDALKAYNMYKKIPFYQNKFRDENGIVYSSDKEQKYPNKEAVPGNYTDSPVVCDSKTKKTTAPPKLLSLASLSARLAGKYKSKLVLDTYQKLYEAQIVSYPRTADKFIGPEQFAEMLPRAPKIAHVAGVDPKLLTHTAPRKTHVKTGGSHGANRPGPKVPESLAALEAEYGSCAAAIYDLLARNYLAMLCEDYEYESQAGHVEKYPDFKGHANLPLSPGWKAVYDADYGDDDDDEGGGAKPLGKNASPFVYEGFPPRPPYPTMKWLVDDETGQLAKHNVGTGATRTSTYAEVTNESSKYPLLIDTRGKISMALCGEMSYRLLANTHIGDISITERVYAEMEAVSKGEANPADCLAAIQTLVREDIETMKANSEIMRKDLNIQAPSVEAAEKFEGVWKKKKVSVKRVWSGHRFTDEECEKLLAGETIEVPGILAKNGNTYTAVGKLSEQTFNGRKYVGFERTGFGSGGLQGIPRAWCGHLFTDAEKKNLEAGRPVEISDAVSKKTGKKFTCILTYEDKPDGSGKALTPKFS